MFWSEFLEYRILFLAVIAYVQCQDLYVEFHGDEVMAEKHLSST